MEIKEYEQEIERLESKIEELQQVVGEKDGEIQELEEKIEELEDDPCDCEDAEGAEYTICGEKVYINCDNLGHQTFFEILSEKSRHYSIQELTDKLKHL